MYVCGLARISSRPLVRSSIVEDASRWRPRPDRPCRSASRSSTIQPMLWRVSSYCLPGLPRPTTSFTMRVRTSWTHGERPRDGVRRGLASWYRALGAPALALPPRPPANRCHAPPHGRVSPAVEGTATMAAATGERNDERRHAASVHLAGTRGRTGRNPLSPARRPGAGRGLRHPGTQPGRARRLPGPIVRGNRRRTGGSPGITVLPTPSPAAPVTGWTKLGATALPAVAKLTATRAGQTSVAPSTAFRLSSLTDTPVRELVSRLVVAPALKLEVARVEDNEALLRPSVPLRQAQIYRFRLLRQDGSPEAAWAVQAAWPLHLVTTLPGDSSQASRVTPGSRSPSTSPASGSPTCVTTCPSRRRSAAGGSSTTRPSCTSRTGTWPVRRCTPLPSGAASRCARPG